MNMELNYLSDNERLQAYETITKGCDHLWSKGKLQKEKLYPVLDTFIKLAEKDPYFLAHFTSYAVKKLAHKDLKVVSVFINSLSDADGTPFSVGSKYLKPNLRMISQAALQELDPKLVLRVIELANLKKKLGSKTEGTHFARSLKTAIKKYITYREQNPRSLMGIRKAGLAKTFKNIYRFTHLSPSTEAAGILNWEQKDGREIEIKKNIFDFKGMSDLQIAEKIRADKLPPTGVMGALPDKLSPVIAAAILEQASGNQVVILSTMFEEQGLLKNAAVKKLYDAKISTAKTALDRVERINKQLDQDIEMSLKTAKSEKRKEDVGDLGKMFMHIDISGSMHEALVVAQDRGAIIAECIKNPQENFYWGVFNASGRRLPRPETFEKDAFAATLYGIRAGGGTDCLALYREARHLGCDIDVYITDQDHNGPSVKTTIDRCTAAGYSKPKAAVIVHIGNAQAKSEMKLKDALVAEGIPTTVITPESLKESALVSQAVKTALRGANAIIEEIMNEPLLSLPRWWETLN